MGLDCIPLCRVSRPYPPPLCHLILAKVSQRACEEIWTDITLDDVLTILDKHYNNVKALDAQNQELFQLQMGEKETMLDWGI